MALLRSAPTLLVDRDAERREIITFYRDTLKRATPPKGMEWEPVKIGPTWEWSPRKGWNLPEITLGWDLLAWAGQWLKSPQGGPWIYTPEQARFILWYYALDEAAQFEYAIAALQRLKGWGKDPLGAAISVTEMVGPVRFDYWDGDRPVGREELNAWVQIVAVSQEQTKNTMKLLPSMVPAETRRYFGMQIGKLTAWAMDDTRQLEAVTSSPLTLEGGRPTQLLLNEIQNWNSSNNGHDMWGVLEGNAAKRDEDSPARMLAIFNAHRPGEDSVAERLRDAFEGTQGDPDADDESERPKFIDVGIMYDSLEAPPTAPLTLKDAPAVIEAVRGDAVWLSTSRIVKSIGNPNNPPSESRRKWYNQVTGSEDAWTTPQAWDQLSRPDSIVAPREEIAMFIDCSKSDDATALVGCRITDGHVFMLGLWQKPPGDRGKGWLAPLDKVDTAVDAAFSRFTVVAFWGDPSHTLDDETRVRYWDTLFDAWHRKYGRKLREFPHVGRAGHSILFDMAIYAEQKRFVAEVQIVEAEIEGKGFTHDGDVRLRKHVIAARRMPTKAGMSIGKEHRESRKKVDAAVSMVGARMARRAYLNNPKRRKGGRLL